MSTSHRLAALALTIAFLAPVAANLYTEALNTVLATSGVWTNTTTDPAAVTAVRIRLEVGETGSAVVVETQATLRNLLW